MCKAYRIFFGLIFEVLIGNVFFSGEISQFAIFIPELGLDLICSLYAEWVSRN